MLRSRKARTISCFQSTFQDTISLSVVNLAPVPLRKIGPGFDLPIVLTLQGAMGLFPKENLRSAMLGGELSLNS